MGKAIQIDLMAKDKKEKPKAQFTQPVKKKSTRRYFKDYDNQVKAFAELGATDQEIADFLKVSVRTIHRWKKSHATFENALKQGKEAADGRVEASLYKRANGFHEMETKVFFRSGDEVPTFVEVKKFYPPDVTAQIFWLKNRMPHNWRDRKDITGGTGGPVKSDASPREALLERMKTTRQRLLTARDAGDLQVDDDLIDVEVVDIET